MIGEGEGGKRSFISKNEIDQGAPMSGGFTCDGIRWDEGDEVLVGEPSEEGRSPGRRARIRGRPLWEVSVKVPAENGRYVKERG